MRINNDKYRSAEEIDVLINHNHFGEWWTKKYGFLKT